MDVSPLPQTQHFAATEFMFPAVPTPETESMALDESPLPRSASLELPKVVVAE
jgi:hypothetical protein